MAARLIDARTSQNASYANSIAVPVTGTPELVGQIGLQTNGLGNSPRVGLKGTAGVLSLTASPVATVSLMVVRGTLPTDMPIYSARHTPRSVGQLAERQLADPDTISISVSDLLPPIPADGQLVYSLFITSDSSGFVRTGPENFDGVLYSD